MRAHRGPRAPRRRPILPLAMAIAAAWSATARAEYVEVRPARDATLIESPTGDLANGSGTAIFAGRVASSSQSLRRAVIAFDIAAAAPAGSTITSARLRLNLSGTSAGPVPIAIHRLRASWGEGASFALGGGGAASGPGDATWRHRFYDDRYWATPGGDFDPAPRASVIVDQPARYLWGSTPALVADVQEWLDLPDRNVGWILVGDESRSQTVKRFDSREVDDAALQPVLEITFLPLCEPAPMGPGYWRRVCGPGIALAPRPAGGGVGEACASRIVTDLLLPPFDPCAAVLAEPPLQCEERALRSLAVLILNVCAGRLQTTCDAAREDASCTTTTVGDRLWEVASLLRAGDCRRAASCAAVPE